MSYSPQQINSIFQAVLQRPADTYAIQLFANSNQSDAQVRTQIETSYEASVNVNPIVRLYEGAFGRVPDTAGLQANYNTYINGYNITGLAQSFLNGPEGVAKFGANVTVTAGFVQTLYTQALNRTAGASEISYWTGTGKSAAQVLAEISNSTEAVNKLAAPTVVYLDSAAVGAPNTGNLYNQSPGTTGNGGTGTGTGQSVAFTTGIDNLAGSTGNDTFTGDNSNVNSPTVQAGDAVNGGAGTDTFNFFGASTTPVVPQLSSVEVVNLIASGKSTTVDFSATNDLQLVTLRNNANGGGTDAVTLKSGVLFGLDNVTGKGTEQVIYTTTNAAPTFGSVALANGSDVGTLKVEGVATTITTINLISTGSAGNTAGNTIGTLSSNGTETTVNISGDRALTITSAFETSVNTVDGSASTGNLKFALGITTANNDSVKTGSGNDVVDIASVGADTVSVNLGSGNDTLKVGASLTTLLSGSTLNGGDGTDVINITDGSTLTSNSVKLISSFETLDVTTGTGTYDVSLGSFAKTQISGDLGTDLAGNVTFSNAPTTFALDVISAKNTDLSITKSITETLKTDATSPATDSFSLNLTSVDGNNDGTAQGKIALASVVANQIENFTINSNISGQDSGVKATNYVNTISTFTDAALTKLVLAGSAGLTITNALDANTTANLTSIDASGETNNVTIDYSNGVKAVSYLGSAGIDTITTTNGGSIYGAGGNDIITLKAVTGVAAVAPVNEVQTITLTASTATVGTDTESATIGNFNGSGVNGGNAITVSTAAGADLTTATKAASALATAINADVNASALVTASVNNGTVTLSYKIAGDAAQTTFNGNADGAGGTVTGTAATTTQGVTAVQGVTGNLDTIVYKSATDAQLTVGSDTSKISSTSTVETINNFVTTGSQTAQVAHDTIDVSNIGGFTGYARGVATVTSANTVLSGNFASSQTNFFVDAGGARGAAALVEGGSSYVFVDANHDGNFTAGSDLVVKLTGVTNVTASDINFG